MQNVFGNTPYAFGNLGLFATLLIVIVVAFLLLLVNPALGIMGAVIALDACSIMGLISINTITLGALTVMAVVASVVVYEKVKR